MKPLLRFEECCITIEREFYVPERRNSPISKYASPRIVSSEDPEIENCKQSKPTNKFAISFQNAGSIP